MGVADVLIANEGMVAIYLGRPLFLLSTIGFG